MSESQATKRNSAPGSPEPREIDGFDDMTENGHPVVSQTLEYLALNEVFIGESLSSRFDY